MFKEDLKKHLNLVFAKDIYLINNGEPASLLQQPNSFRELIAPMPSTTNQICLHWNSFPNDDYQKIQYRIRVSSSDITIMPTPTMTINGTGFIPLYEQHKSKFLIMFPCTGLRDGIVDLGFHLNYTAVDSRDERHLKFTIRRHCTRHKGTHRGTVKNLEAQDVKTPTHDLIIGFSVAGTILVSLLLSFFGYWQLKRRKRELQEKFDYDYEMMVKKRQEENDIQTVKKIEDEDMKGKEENLVQKLETLPPPIFSKNGQKLKSSKYSKNFKMWMDTLKQQTSTGTLNMASNHFGLEQIPEEEALLNERNETMSNKNESAILINNHAVNNDSNERRTLNEVSDTSTFLKKCHQPLKDDEFEDVDKGLTITTATSDDLLPISSIELPMKKKQLKKAFHKPGVDKTYIDSGCEGRLGPLYQYLNHKWMKHFNDCLLTPQQLIMMKQTITAKSQPNNLHQGKLKEVDNDDNIKFTPVAIKTLIHASEENNSMSKFINEALLLKKLRHKNIMGLTGVLLQPKQAPVIVMPFMKYGDLNQFLRNARGTPRRHQTISTRQLVNFSVQIACGMEYLASMKYVHRDLATRNCMLGEDFEVKISNLGLARDISKENYRMNKKTRLPIKWMAPESLNNFVFSEKSDVWSYGVVLWEIINLAKQPYSGLDNSNVQDFLMKGKRLEKPPNCPEEFFHLMSLCWIHSPHDRPSFKQLHKQIALYEAKYQKYSIEYTTNSMVT